jgi:hypothetical protein
MLRLIPRAVVFAKVVADLRFELGSEKQRGEGGTGPGCVEHALNS